MVEVEYTLESIAFFIVSTTLQERLRYTMANINENLPHNFLAREQRVSFTPLDRWYQLTSPPEPAQGASFARRDAARRGRLTSIVLFFLMMILCRFVAYGSF